MEDYQGYLQSKLQESLARPCSSQGEGRGIVLCAGGLRLSANAYVALRRLRQLTQLPIELFHAGPAELPSPVRSAWSREFKNLTFRDLWQEDLERLPGSPARAALRGYPIKPFAMLCSSFREVLFLDADNFAVTNPEVLFEHPLYQESGALFWPDLPTARYSQDSLFQAFGLPARLNRSRLEFESGQMVLDKGRCLPALVAACVLNGEKLRPFVYARNDAGDKDTFRVGFHFTGLDYRQVETPPLEFGANFLHYVIPWNQREITVPLRRGRFYATGILQHHPDGEPMFLHKTVHAWSVYRNFRVMTHLKTPTGVLQPQWMHELEELGFRYLRVFRPLRHHYPIDWKDLKSAVLMKLGAVFLSWLNLR